MSWASCVRAWIWQIFCAIFNKIPFSISKRLLAMFKGITATFKEVPFLDGTCTWINVRLKVRTLKWLHSLLEIDQSLAQEDPEISFKPHSFLKGTDPEVYYYTKEPFRANRSAFRSPFESFRANRSAFRPKRSNRSKRSPIRNSLSRSL
jgi:hypothetical protein